MKSIKLSIALCLSIFLIQNNSFAQKWWGNGITGEGEKIKKELKVDNFEGVTLHFSGNVVLTHGSDFSVMAEGQENIIDNIETDVSGGIWEVEFDKNVRNHKELTIYITMPKLTKAAIYGSGDIRTTNHFPRVSELNCGISGSGDLLLDVEAGKLDAKISGSGDIKLEGKADNLGVRISGSGDLDAFELNSDHVSVGISGSGDVKVVANESLDVRVSGSGDVYYKGRPDKMKSSVSGSGDVTSRN